MDWVHWEHDYFTVQIVVSYRKPQSAFEQDAFLVQANGCTIRRNPSMHEAALKALKSSVRATCYLIVVVRTASAEEKRRASPTLGLAAISTTPNQSVREAATRAVRLIDRTSANFLTTRACFTCHTQTLSAMVLRDARKVGFESLRYKGNVGHAF
jgi:hypothetical protein